MRNLQRQFRADEQTSSVSVSSHQASANAPADFVIQVLRSELHTIRKCFSGTQLVDWVKIYVRDHGLDSLGVCIGDTETETGLELGEIQVARRTFFLMGHVTKILLFLVIIVLRTDHYFWTGTKKLYAASAANNFFVSPPSCKHFFHLHTIYFSVYSFCKQFMSKFSKPPPPPHHPRQKNNGPSLSSFTHTQNTRIDYEKHSKKILSAREN